jgi:hypothetical protein
MGFVGVFIFAEPILLAKSSISNSITSCVITRPGGLPPAPASIWSVTSYLPHHLQFLQHQLRSGLCQRLRACCLRSQSLTPQQSPTFYLLYGHSRLRREIFRLQNSQLVISKVSLYVLPLNWNSFDNLIFSR